MTSEALLEALVGVLVQIQSLIPRDKQAWADDEMLRLALERLWITAGNLAEAYRLAADVPSGVEPWSELYGFRSVLAHALPGDIAPDRMWHETTVALPRLLSAVQSAGS